MSNADEAFVYFNEETILHKRLEKIEKKDVYDAFGTSNLKVFTSSKELQSHLFSEDWTNSNLLMMSSGTFDGLDFNKIADKII
jgi:UDP-N-acetylmuramate: L-alanyl-gamma-D-glutamyl-meso-diaminopimelate ligase